MSLLNNPVALLKAMLARIPLILKTLVYHGLQVTPASKKQDLRTEIIVAIIRSFLDMSVSVSAQQRRSMNDPGIKGPMWVSKVTLPAPEEAVAEAVLHAVKTLSEGDEYQTLQLPPVNPVEAEWTGYRGGVDKNAPLPDISEQDKYEALKAEAKSDLVIFYIHGGALYLMDPCTHRVPVAHICKLTGARAINVRYRLAPQNPFPAALVDLLTAYLTLIYPPEGSYHEAVPANKIVLAGDSAGGNLSLALLQTLLTLKRTLKPVQFHGREVSIDLPAGVSLISPWCDITRSMPSIRDNAVYDYLVPPPHEPSETMYHPTTDTPDSIWPSSPPRSDLYCSARLVAHPLVSPLACPKELWQGAPPIYVTTGEEGLTDEDLLTARKIHHAGVPVVVEQYEGMPHVFGFIMIASPAGKLFFQGWSQFLRDVLAGPLQSSRGDLGKVIYHHAGWHSSKVLALDEVHDFSDAEVEKVLRDSRDHRAEWEKKLNEEWQAKARL